MSSRLSNTMGLHDLQVLLREFAETRGWTAHHTPVNLAIAISVEAAELLEHFQWGTDKDRGSLEEVANELADVMLYSITLANALDCDLGELLTLKIAENEKRFPPKLPS